MVEYLPATTFRKLSSHANVPYPSRSLPNSARSRASSRSETSGGSQSEWLSEKSNRPSAAANQRTSGNGGSRMTTLPNDFLDSANTKQLLLPLRYGKLND